MRPITDLIHLEGKHVLVRLDTDVEIAGGRVVDDLRLRAALPSVRYLASQGARVTLLGHLGRPKGEVVEGLRLEPVATYLAKLLVPGHHGAVIPAQAGISGGIDSRSEASADFRSGMTTKAQESPVLATTYQLAKNVTLLENLRFDPGEEANEPEFVSLLVRDQDYFVNEAFATCHREAASIVGLPEKLPAYGGLRLVDELAHLDIVKDSPTHPFTLIVGGAKVEEKLGLLEKLLPKVDHVLTGGVVANTFLATSGLEVKQSQVGEQYFEAAKRLLAYVIASPPRRTKQSPQEIATPPHNMSSPTGSIPDRGSRHRPYESEDSRSAIAAYASDSSELHSVGNDRGRGKIHLPVDFVWHRDRIADLGPETLDQYRKVIAESQTVFWAGSLGVTEDERFQKGTRTIAESLAKHPGIRLVGGGDTVAALTRFGLAGKMSFTSVGGGAALAYLAGETLPGLAALSQH